MSQTKDDPRIYQQRPNVAFLNEGHKFMTVPCKAAIALVFSSLFQPQAFAHGEDKPGPNGGFVRMPGAFHTELVEVNDQKFKVYLLDTNWKNPTVKNSSLEASVRFQSETVRVVCKAVNSSFTCELPKGKSLKSAQEISLNATRENATGGLANYEMPLKFFSH